MDTFHQWRAELEPAGFKKSAKGQQNRERKMLHYAVVFFIIAIIAAVLGFGGIAAGAASIAKILFFIFIVLAVLSLIFGGRFRK
jgi:uncharacterized membrane protein YtjA (UPF0391 family)